MIYFFILSARMVHCCVVLLRCPLQPAVTLVVTPRLRRGPGERDGGSAPQGGGEAMVTALREPWGRWTAGWSTLDAPLPKVAAGLWLWQRRRQAWLGFTLCPWFLQTRGKGAPAAPHLCSGMEGKAGRGMAKSNGLWSPLLQAPSSSFSQLLPSPLHCTLQDELFVCHLAPPKHLCRAEGWGRWV